MARLLDIPIHDDETFLQACDCLHDATFKEDDVSDSASGELKIILEREYFEDRELIEESKTWFPGFFRARYPLVRSKLVLTGIRSITRKGPRRYKQTDFLEARIKKNHYHLLAPPVTWVIEFSNGPQGSLQDMEILAKRRTAIQFTPLGCLAAVGVVLLGIGIAVLLSYVW